MTHNHLLQPTNVDYFFKDISVFKAKSNINAPYEDMVQIQMFDELFTIFSATADELENHLTIEERQQYVYRDDDGCNYFDDCQFIERLSDDKNFALELCFRTRD